MASVCVKDMQHDLEQLTKELRQVNLQQFIQQTGTKVTVLPAEPTEDDSSHASQTIGTIFLNMFPTSILGVIQGEGGIINCIF